MIKFFQKLKAKKGFTLVELIVVIAIIGVLAAILIPTMLGYVTSSRVTSADSTTASIKNNIGTFLTNADTAGYGMKQANDNIATLKITIEDSTWNVTKEGGEFKTAGSLEWTNDGSGAANDPKTDAQSAEDLLAIELANLFPDVDNAYIQATLKAGACTAVAFTADDTAFGEGDCPEVDDNGEFPDAFEWDSKTAGVGKTGIIVGTAPAVPLGSTT